ncbi:efflux RND transporter periplasmic adaptor subunit [Flavobacterium sp.]|uniref:efflux RND transporter periplasmic adaptor subunit n=1 Tax=Flavobacterium sp. TaxID=239 RepID=UPI0031E3F1C9
MKVKHLIYTLLIITIGGFITYRIISNKGKNDDSKKFNDKKSPTTVNGIVIKTTTFDNNLALSGSIEANEQIEIHSEVSGIVEGIFFNEGANVSKGQVLLKVNDIELKAQLRQAITREELAAENARRAKLLLQKEAISQEEADVAKADLASAQAQSQLIRAQISKTSVRAPFSGKIGLRNISPGTYITPTVLVAKLVNTNKLKITFSIPEKYASEVKSGSVIDFKVSGSDKTYNAKIYAIEPEVAVATRTLQIRALADNNDGKLFPGTFADIKLPLNIIKDAIVVPSQAIIPIQDGKKVFVANNGQAKEVMVDATTRTDSSILILAGLKPGDTLITSGVMSLKNEAPIKVQVK